MMAWQPVPINQPVHSNIDEVSLTNRTPNRYNTYRNAAGHTTRRPGYEDFADMATSAQVDGIYDWASQGFIIVVSSQDVFKVRKNGSIQIIGSGLFELSNRVVWADFGDTLYGANGGDIIKITSGLAEALTDPDIPANVSHVAAFDTYLLANKGGTGRMYFSDVLSPEDWTDQYVTAEQSPDLLVAVHSRWNEIWLFGEKTVELWYNDGVTPFVPFSGGVISTGCLSPHTIKYARDSYYWVNENREVVRSTGQSYQIISDPIKNLLRDSESVSDAIGDYVTVGGEDWYILSLPSYGDFGVTIVYDIRKDEWQGEWNYFETTDFQNSRYRIRQFRMNAYTYVPLWNLHLIGDTRTGEIYSLSKEFSDDAGDLIRSYWVTGNINHGSSLRKRSYKLWFRILRGEGATDSAPVFMLRWRDDGSKVWSNTIELSLGESGDYEYFVAANRLGMYRTRQYELSVTDGVPFVVAEAMEDIEVIPR